MKKRSKKVKVSSFEGVAAMIADLNAEMNDQFSKLTSAMSSRFDKLEAELEVIKRTLDRIDTRLAALELAVFGASASGGGKIVEHSILERLSKLEDAVFKR